MDLGARRGGATAPAGLIDGAGYFGAIPLGLGMGAVAEQAGWTTAFRMLAIVAAHARDPRRPIAYVRLQRPPRTRRAPAA